MSSVMTFVLEIIRLHLVTEVRVRIQHDIINDKEEERWATLGHKGDAIPPEQPFAIRAIPLLPSRSTR